MAMDDRVLAKALTTGYIFKDLTPSDVTVYLPEEHLKALLVKSAGDVVMDDHAGNTNVTITCSAGQYLYLRPYRVKAATTASVIGIFS